MVIKLMDHFTKYYSYNQLIEEHDILVMTQQEYLANKDQLDNPQQIVLVNREGGPKPPKPPKWFSTWCEQEFKPLVKDVQNIKQILKRNNIH